MPRRAASSISGNPLSTTPITAVAGTSTLSKVISAARNPSIVWIAAPRDAEALDVDDEQRDARLVAGAARGARRNDDPVCAVAIDHDALVTVEHIAAASSSPLVSTSNRSKRDCGSANPKA